MKAIFLITSISLISFFGLAPQAIHAVSISKVQSAFGGDTTVYVFVEEMPLFKSAKNKTESTKLIDTYIKECITRDGIKETGNVLVSFVVDSTGKTQDIQILRSNKLQTNSLAVKYIADMPKWQPGKQAGKAVSVRMTVFVKFK